MNAKLARRKARSRATAQARTAAREAQIAAVKARLLGIRPVDPTTNPFVASLTSDSAQFQRSLAETTRAFEQFADAWRQTMTTGAAFTRRAT